MQSFFKNKKLIDLSHRLNPEIPTWDGSCGFSEKRLFDYPEGLRSQSFTCNASAGTHIDAPAHMVQGGEFIDQIPLENFLVPACVIDISKPVLENSSYRLSTQDISEFERLNGQIESGSLIIVRSGWEDKWRDSHLYRNPDSKGDMRFPSVSTQAAELLLKRNIMGLGIDSLSPDGSDLQFPVHNLLFAENKYIIENLTGLKSLPSKGAWIIALPIKIEGGTESWSRIIALVDR